MPLYLSNLSRLAPLTRAFTFVICLLAPNVWAQSAHFYQPDFVLYPAGAALQRELFDIMLSETNDYTYERIQTGVLYKNSQTPHYQKLVNELCHKKEMIKCPEVYFTKKEIVGAKMEPNGILNVYPASMEGMNDTQIKFYLYHEIGHFYLEHAKIRTFEMARSVQDNSIMVIDAERILSSAGFLPGMKELRQRLEEDADWFAYTELGEERHNFQCASSLRKISGNQEVSTQEHKSIDERCEQLNKSQK